MLTNRRHLILGTAAMAAVTCISRIATAQAVAGPFHLNPLPYPTNAFEPYIDAKTMEIHHDRHHQAYVNNLNAAVKDYPAVAAMPLLEILAKLGEVPESIRTAVRNNGGGHANHSMFWQVMGRAAARRRETSWLQSSATSAVSTRCRVASMMPECGCSVPGGRWSASRGTALSPSRPGPIRIRR